VIALAGWEREEGPPELCTSDAYDLLYFAVLEGLPSCRCCW
jgi:hypothetical protein